MFHPQRSGVWRSLLRNAGRAGPQTKQDGPKTVLSAEERGDYFLSTFLKSAFLSK